MLDNLITNLWNIFIIASLIGLIIFVVTLIFSILEGFFKSSKNNYIEIDDENLKQLQEVFRQTIKDMIQQELNNRNIDK